MRNILIVEDDKSQREVLKKMLATGIVSLTSNPCKVPDPFQKLEVHF